MEFFYSFMLISNLLVLGYYGVRFFEWAVPLFNRFMGWFCVRYADQIVSTLLAVSVVCGVTAFGVLLFHAPSDKQHTVIHRNCKCGAQFVCPEAAR